MADIGVKMGVSGIAQFKTAMNQANQSVKTLDAALKLNEKQLQATGDKETYMAQKSKLLQQQIAAQNSVVKQGQAALRAMEQQGVDPASTAYQKMQQQVLNAQTALLGMNSDLSTVGQSAQETAQQTDKLTDSLNGINKKVSFDAVLNGIGKITDGMEAAARKVAALARDVWDTMAMAATWADDETTLAQLYGIDVETLQKMQKVAENEIQTPVEAIIKAKQKLAKELTSGSKEIQEGFEKLGLGHYSTKYGSEFIVQEFSNEEDAMWAIGEALMRYNNEIERDAMAQQFLGRSWMEMRPLFQAGREEYEKALEEQSAVSAENVGKINELSGAMKNLQQDAQTTGYTILAEMAPGFTELAKGLSGLLEQFNEYLETPEGKEMMEGLSEAVTDLFTGLTDVDFSSAIETAGGILDTITGALGWIKDNKDDVVNAIKGIGDAFLAMKAAEVVGTLVQAAAGLKILMGGGNGAAGAGAGAGASEGSVPSVPVTGTPPGWLKILSIFGLGKTAYESSRELGTGLFGALFGNNRKTVAGVEELPVVQNLNLHRPTGNAGTASGSMGTGAVRTAEMIYDDLYQAINDYEPEGMMRSEAETFFDNVLSPLVSEAAQKGGVVGEDADAIAEHFKEKFIQSLYDEEWEGTTQGLLNILQEEIDEKAPALSVTALPVLDDSAAAVLQEQLNSMSLTVPIGSHANGLPFVPFDGYIAALHKGERVVPASQSKSYNNTSNIYFDKVNVNSGIDADGLAARIAEQNRRTLAGFGG